MTHSFFVSLSDVNMDRSTFRSMNDLQREPDWRLGADYLQRLRDLLDRIPPLERDVIELYYFHEKRQDTIARMLKLSQQAVSHRLHSAYRRIIFMLEQPEVTVEQMRRDLRALLPKAFTVDVLCYFAQTSSQTATAKKLKVPQQRVCWHLNAALKQLKASPSMDAVFYYQYFTSLRKHRNILREVSAGHRRTRGSHDKTAHRYSRRYGRGPASSYAAPISGTTHTTSGRTDGGPQAASAEQAD